MIKFGFMIQCRLVKDFRKKMRCFQFDRLTDRNLTIIVKNGWLLDSSTKGGHGSE